MGRRTRLLLLASAPWSTRLIVGDGERVVLDETVHHESSELSARKDDVLAALHHQGMNLTRFDAVAVWACTAPGQSADSGSAAAPGQHREDWTHRHEPSVVSIASAIGGQLHIPCFWLSHSDPSANADELVRRAVQIYRKGV